MKPVGIPGASSPMQMTPDHLKSKMFPQTPSPSPLRGKIVPVNKRTGELDMGDELSGFGLQGVKVTKDELQDLIAELGLNGDEAGDLAAGLTDMTNPVKGLKSSKKTSKALPVEGLAVKKEEKTQKMEPTNDEEPTSKEETSEERTSEKETIAEDTEANKKDASQAVATKIEDKLDNSV